MAIATDVNKEQQEKNVNFNILYLNNRFIEKFYWNLI